MEWINVEKKLPNLYQLVLVCDKVDSKKTVCVGYYVEEDEEMFWYEKGTGALLKLITHWMQLPKPPKE